MINLLRKLDFDIVAFDRRWLIAVISTLLASNLLINIPVVERYFSPDHSVLYSTKRMIYIYHLITVLLALALTWVATSLQRFRFTIKLHHVILFLLTAEVLLRVNMFSRHLNVRPLQNPNLYGDGSCGDDAYWVLAQQYYFQANEPAEDREGHPLLGWTGPHGELEIFTDRYFRIDQITRRPLLFFGDSFVKHGLSMDEKIPQLMDVLLPRLDVLNYGVGGYGTDQITLRVKSEFPRFADKKPIVLVGITLDDMDRVLLRYRGSQKPYYEIEDDQLVLNVPKFRTNREFLDAFRFPARPLLLSALKTAVGRFIPLDLCAQRRYDLNFKIMEDLSRFVVAHEISAHIVIFYSHNELGYVSRRERELKRILSELHITNVVDTKNILLPYLEKSGLEPHDLYLFGPKYEIEIQGHHSPEANQVIAAGIVEYLAHASTLERRSGFSACSDPL